MFRKTQVILEKFKVTLGFDVIPAFRPLVTFLHLLQPDADQCGGRACVCVVYGTSLGPHSRRYINAVVRAVR